MVQEPPDRRLNAEWGAQTRRRLSMFGLWLDGPIGPCFRIHAAHLIGAFGAPLGASIAARNAPGRMDLDCLLPILRVAFFSRRGEYWYLCHPSLENLEKHLRRRLRWQVAAKDVYGCDLYRGR